MLAPNTPLQSRYVILKQEGRGGMGAVYKAYDQRLRTDVALKQTLFTGESDLRRFEREAQLLARLRHRGLPKVSDYFTEGEGQYLVMEYITGAGIDELRQHDSSLAGPTSLPRILEWMDQLLDILEYLHNRRSPIVHRDIKPKNLKLSDRDEIVLLDFGLARGGFSQDTPPDGATQRPDTGLMIHTPPYAPLEQVRGEDADPRNDLYSLGATFYFILTGKPPEDPMQRATTLSLRGDPLRPLIEVLPWVPPILSELIHWLMALLKEDRPQTAKIVREELQIIRSSLAQRRERTPHPRSRESAPPIPSPALLPRVAASERPSFETAVRTITTGSHIRAVAINHGGSLIAAGYDDHTIGLWDLKQGQQINLLQGHSGVVRSVAFSQNRRQLLVSGSDDGCVRLWHISGQSYELERRNAAVGGVSFSPDGQWLAVCGWTGGTALWQWQGSRFVQVRRLSNAFTNCVSWSPNGQLLAEGRFDGSVAVWNTQTQQQHLYLKDYPVIVFCVAFSPDGQLLAAGGNNNTIYLWRTSDGRRLDIFQGHLKSVRSIAWSPDGELLASASEDGTARIWSTSEGSTRYPPLPHQSGVACVAWAPDGRLLVTGSYDTKLRLWQMPV